MIFPPAAEWHETNCSSGKLTESGYARDLHREKSGRSLSFNPVALDAGAPENFLLILRSHLSEILLDDAERRSVVS